MLVVKLCLVGLGCLCLVLVPCLLLFQQHDITTRLSPHSNQTLQKRESTTAYFIHNALATHHSACLTKMLSSLVCRDRELQLWNARLAGKQGGADDKGMAKQGTTHAIMAWCHQPALRVRFSAGQLEALAGRRELR